MLSDVALVDTNVLVYSLYESAEQHDAASRLLDRAQEGQCALCVSPQVLAELYATITNPRRVSSPYEPAEALDVVERLVAMRGVAVVSMPADLVQRWVALLRHRPVKGRHVFDVQIIATMLANGVKRVYTYNRRDFEPFDEIEVLTP